MSKSREIQSLNMGNGRIRKKAIIKAAIGRPIARPGMSKIAHDRKTSQQMAGARRETEVWEWCSSMKKSGFWGAKGL